jgi:hypothetical protein
MILAEGMPKTRTKIMRMYESEKDKENKKTSTSNLPI